MCGGGFVAMNLRLALVVFVAIFQARFEVAADAPPNIVMIVSDDQGWGDFGFMGHPAIKTPNLDRLASQGATFANGYVVTPLCRPSLASIVTGLYPHQHKIWSNDPPEGQKREVMGEWMKAAPAM